MKLHNSKTHMQRLLSPKLSKSNKKESVYRYTKEYRQIISKNINLILSDNCFSEKQRLHSPEVSTKATIISMGLAYSPAGH